MDTAEYKKRIVSNVYRIEAGKVVALHKHANADEIFYCVAGEGFGVLEDSEQELTIGKAFIVPAGVMHSLRSDSELVVASFLVPLFAKQGAAPKG